MSCRPPIGKVPFHVSFPHGILPCILLNQAKIPHHSHVVCPISISPNTWLRMQSDKFLCQMPDPRAILQYTHHRQRESVFHIHGQRFSASILRRWSHRAIAGLLGHFVHYPSIGLHRRTFFRILQGRGIQHLQLQGNRDHRQRHQTVYVFPQRLHWSNLASFLTSLHLCQSADRSVFGQPQRSKLRPPSSFLLVWLLPLRDFPWDSDGWQELSCGEPLQPFPPFFHLCDPLPRRFHPRPQPCSDRSNSFLPYRISVIQKIL